MPELEDEIGIANPTHPHCATVLVLDTSGSMEGEKMRQLSEGLAHFQEDASSDDLARKRVDLAVVTFGETVDAQAFCSIDAFQPPVLIPGGRTPMGQAILKAIELLEQRKREYRANGTDFYRPWIFLITDGAPTDMQPGDLLWSQVTDAIRSGEASHKFLFWAVAVEPADSAMLAQIAPPNRAPVQLKTGRFKEMFQWLSKSQAAISASRLGQQVALESPAGWAAVSSQ